MTEATATPITNSKVISVATIKGGSGKSTLVACLANFWQQKRSRVALIDTDPNGTLTRWHKKGEDLSKLTLRAEKDEWSVISTVAELSREHEIVLIDCAGFASQAMLIALGVSETVLIPVMTDEANIYEAVRTQRLVERTASINGRPINALAVLNRVRKTRVATHSRKQLEQLGVKPARTVLTDRTAFQEASFYGSSPIALAPQSPAATEIRKLGQEIETFLKLDTQTTQDGTNHGKKG